jgi:tetratricopeptide (TPR) repeat protein
LQDGKIDMKRSSSIWVALGWILCGCAAGQPPAPEPTDWAALVNSVQRAVVLVTTYDARHEVIGIGTGFFVDDQGHLVTNYHVLKGAYAAEVKFHDGRTGTIAAVTATDEIRDVVKVRLDNFGDNASWLAAGRQAPAVADTVLVVGNPLGLEQTVSKGIISAVRDLPGIGRIFQISAPISSGSSGGPVVNGDGQAVGIVTFQSTVGQNLNFAVSTQVLDGLTPEPTPLPLPQWTYRASGEKSEAAEALCREGFKFFLNGQYQEALRFYREAVERHPRDADAWNGLGGCYAGLERPEEALAAFTKSVELRPDDPNARFELGGYYHKMGRTEEALATLEAVVAQYPDYAPGHFAIGLMYNELKVWPQARDAYLETLRIAPGFIPARLALARGYGRAGRHDEALAAYRRVLAEKPDNAVAYYGVGEVYLSVGRRGEAADAFRRAIRADPDHAPSHFGLGRLQVAAGERAAALEQYKVLRRLSPELAEKLFELIY